MKGPLCSKCKTHHFTTQPCPADQVKVGKVVASRVTPPKKIEVKKCAPPESPIGDTAPGSALTASELASLGGKARAEKMTPEERSAAAKKAADARWAKE